MTAKPTTRRGLLAALLVQSAVFATAASTHAALITWGAATNISGDSDVSTAGTLVGAFNFGSSGVATTTVNGTTFTGLALSGTLATSGNFSLSTAGGFSSGTANTPNPPFSLLSAPYRTLLSTLAGSSSTRPITLTMGGLTAGATYQFQWWSNDSVDGAFITTATAGDAVTLLSNASGASGGVGQLAIGTFVADATNAQTIVFSSTGGLSILNGIQLRQLAPAPAAVPEPGTALAGVMLAGLVGLRRRRPTV